MKTKLILACFFALGVACLLFVVSLQSKRIEALQSAKNTLQANNQLLIDKMKRAYNDKMELSRKTKELEALAERDVSFDWNADISRSDIVSWLRENSNSVR